MNKVSITKQAISLARRFPVEKVIEQRGIKLSGRNELVGPCPRCGGHDRFAINIRKQVWNCRGCTEGGDVIALVMFLDSSTFREACETLTGESLGGGTNKPQCNPERQRQYSAVAHERRQQNKARWLFGASKAALGTPVESYTRTRGIAAPLPSTVRFLPPLKSNHYPAMLVPYDIPTEPEPSVLDIAKDAISAVQLTLLMPDGCGKADVKLNKITIGSPAGTPMVLAPVNDQMGLAITEGVEDALTAHRVTGLGAWASGGAVFMPKLATVVPEYVEAVTIYAHSDEAGQRHARELADVLDGRGIEIRIEGIRR